MIDVERVARALCKATSAHPSYKGCEQVCAHCARLAAAAMAETRLIDAEAARTEAAERKERHQWQIAANWKERADWLTTRAKETGNAEG